MAGYSGAPLPQETDVTEDTVRQAALAAGLVDNKVCAVDQTWSALRCVIRLKDRPAPVRGGQPAARRGRPSAG